MGAGLGALARVLEARRSYYFLPACTELVLGFCFVINNDGMRRVMHFVGVVLCWILLVRDFGGVLAGFVGHQVKGFPSDDGEVRVVRCFFWLMTSIAFSLMEVDRINARSSVAESEELRLGYEGSIQYARCSQEADAVSIRREISDQVDQVDHAIHVLLAAGMSTPALREIARSVDIRHAAFAEITGAMFLLGPFATTAISTTVVDMLRCECLWHRVVLVIVSILSRLMLFALLCRSDWDEERFILKVMNKFLSVAVICWLSTLPFLLSLHVSKPGCALFWLFVSDFLLLSMLCIAILGIRGTARLPFGRQILGQRGGKILHFDLGFRG